MEKRENRVETGYFMVSIYYPGGGIFDYDAAYVMCKAEERGSQFSGVAEINQAGTFYLYIGALHASAWHVVVEAFTAS